MKKNGIEYWVEYNHRNGIAENIRIFRDPEEAERFAGECNGIIIKVRGERV